LDFSSFVILCFGTGVPTMQCLHYVQLCFALMPAVHGAYPPVRCLFLCLQRLRLTLWTESLKLMQPLAQRTLVMSF